LTAALKYLLINHLPFGRSATPGRFFVRDMWLEDLRAQVAALRAAGMEVTVAAPLVDVLAAQGSSATVEIDPVAEDFRYVPLPHYVSFAQFVQKRAGLRNVLLDAIAEADIVQMGYGGHPVPLGAVAWPLAGRRNKKRIWMFDGGDPFPQWTFHACQIRNPLKRWLRLKQLGRLEKFVRQAVADADLVIAHNKSVVERFQDVWHSRCHQFHRTFVTKDLLISNDELRDRQEKLLDRSHPLRVTATGRQIAIKGTDQLLRAFRRAIDRGANLELEVIGDGEDLPRYQTLAGELALGPRVRFIGAVPYGTPLFDAWRRHDVLVVTNLTSEFSRNLLLAMARGLPLITYSNPGDAIVEPSGAAIVVPMGDVEALAGALVEAERDRQRLAQLAGRALELVRDLTLEECHRRRAELAAAAAVGIAALTDQKDETG